MERAGWKPSDDHHHLCPSCPRCGCPNTKFCYYNNYSLTQPRYFCKGCRRYWTKGGSLRNVPVGGGCRKNRRGSKPLRLPTTTTTDGHVHESSTYGGNVHKSYGTNAVMSNSMGDSTTSSVSTQDGASNIDIALVYANFLNQKPESSNSAGSDHQLPELPSEFDLGSLKFSSMALGMNNANSGSSSIQLMEDHQHQNGLVGSHGVGCHTSTSLPHHHDMSTENCSANIDHMYFGVLDPLIHHQKHHHFHDEIDFGLPPLPGQEALWSSSSQMMVSGISSTHAMQAVTPLLGPDDHDPHLLIGSWTPFDLPCNETFSRST